MFPPRTRQTSPSLLRADTLRAVRFERRHGEVFADARDAHQLVLLAESALAGLELGFGVVQGGDVQRPRRQRRRRDRDQDDHADVEGRPPHVVRGTPEQVEALKQKYAIYIVGSGRINVAGITEQNVSPLCEAIADVVK